MPLSSGQVNLVSLTPLNWCIVLLIICPGASSLFTASPEHLHCHCCQPQCILLIDVVSPGASLLAMVIPKRPPPHHCWNDTSLLAAAPEHLPHHSLHPWCVLDSGGGPSTFYSLLSAPVCPPHHWCQPWSIPLVVVVGPGVSSSLSSAPAHPPCWRWLP